jgi:AcrR family transcriptional regulator
MGRPPATSSRDTRQALMDAGLEVFAEKGYFGASLRDIARAVGVRESALYHYFASKEALFEAILEERPSAGQALEQVLTLPVTSARALLEKVGLAMIERFSSPRERKIFRVMMSDGMRLASEGRINFFERMGSGATRMMRVMDHLVAQGHLRKAPPNLLALEFFAPFQLFRQMLAVNPSSPLVSDPRAFVRGHVDLFLRGAAGRKV